MAPSGRPFILTADAGNSSISLGLFRGESLVASFSMPTRPHASSRAYFQAFREFLEREGLPLSPGAHKRTEHEASKSRTPVSAILSSVVPALTTPLSRALRRLTGSEPIILSTRTPCGLTFDVPHPDRIGPDRIANAVAAYERVGGPVAVADFGTATTITVVGKNATFLGGAILPGLGLMAASLETGTARLPRVAIDGLPSPLGRDTDGAIRAGLIIGSAGAVEKILEGIEKELGFDVQLVLTGGYAPCVAPAVKRKHTVVPGLTLDGLRLICIRNIRGTP